MANRRMFSKDITNSEEFLEMPEGPQSLYFHLGMNADDEGFVQPKAVMRLVEAKEDSLRILIAKGFVIQFGGSSKVIVITHWKTNNELKKDRFKNTLFKEEKKMLCLKDGKYEVYPECIHNVSTLETQDSIGKDRIEENSIVKRDEISFLTSEQNSDQVDDESGLSFSAKQVNPKNSPLTSYTGKTIPIYQSTPKKPPKEKITANKGIGGKPTLAIMDEVVYEEEIVPKKKARTTPEHIIELNAIRLIFEEYGFRLGSIKKQGSKYDLNLPVIKKMKEEIYGGDFKQMTDDLIMCVAEMAKGEKYFPTFENMLEYRDKMNKIKIYFTKKNNQQNYGQSDTVSE